MLSQPAHHSNMGMFMTHEGRMLCSIMWTVTESHTQHLPRCASPACVRLLQVVVPRDFYAELANGSGSGHLDVGMVEQVTHL